jgi:hypothetical protein
MLARRTRYVQGSIGVRHAVIHLFIESVCLLWCCFRDPMDHEKRMLEGR